MPSLRQLADLLDAYLDAGAYVNDQAGIFRASMDEVRRIGLALEPWVGVESWAMNENLDGLFLHRPWKLEEHNLDASIGVLAYHLAFDEHLTLGFNPRLAVAFGLRGIEVIGEKEGRPLGMIGDVRAVEFDLFVRATGEIFGGIDEARPLNRASNEVRRVAIVGAMTDKLVREADERGADVYVTGQWRFPAKDAVRETGIGVIAVGHRRTEEWGLRALAGLLRERWEELDVVLGV